MHAKQANMSCAKTLEMHCCNILVVKWHAVYLQIQHHIPIAGAPGLFATWSCRVNDNTPRSLESGED